MELYLQDLNGAATKKRAIHDSDEHDLVKLGIKVVDRCIQHLDESVGKERLPRTFKALNILKVKFNKG